MLDLNMLIGASDIQSLSDDELITAKLQVCAEIDSKGKPCLFLSGVLYRVNDEQKHRTRNTQNRTIYSKFLEILTGEEKTTPSKRHMGRVELGKAIDWLLNNYEVKEH